MKLSDDAKANLFIASVIGVIVAIVFCMSYFTSKDQAVKTKCEESCGIKKSMVLFEGCHCKTETGWEKAK